MTGLPDATPRTLTVERLSRALEDALCDCAGPFPDIGWSHEPRCSAVGSEHQLSADRLAKLTFAALGPVGLPDATQGAVEMLADAVSDDWTGLHRRTDDPDGWWLNINARKLAERMLAASPALRAALDGAGRVAALEAALRTIDADSASSFLSGDTLDVLADALAGQPKEQHDG